MASWAPLGLVSVHVDVGPAEGGGCSVGAGVGVGLAVASASVSARASGSSSVAPSRSPRASRTVWPWPWRRLRCRCRGRRRRRRGGRDRRNGGLDLGARSRHRHDHVVVPVTEHERVAAPLDQRGTLERLEEGRLLGHDVVGADLAGGREPADADQVPVGAVGAVVRVAPARPADVRDPEHRRQLRPADGDRLRPRGSGKGVDHPRPEQRVLRSGVEHEDRLAAVAVDREGVGADPVEPAVMEDGQVRRLEGHDDVAARLLGRGELRDQQGPAAGACEPVVVIAAGEAVDASSAEVRVGVERLRDDLEGPAVGVRAQHPGRGLELTAGTAAR